jgi:hypothetical protein
MRVGHKSSCLNDRFETDTQVSIGDVLVEKRQLINEHCAQHEPASCAQASCGYAAMSIEDTLELLVEVLDSQRTSLVQYPAHLDTGVSVRVGMSLTITGGHQHNPSLSAQPVKVRVGIVDIAQQEAQCSRQFTDKSRGFLIVCGVSGSKNSSQWYPYRRCGGYQVQLPAVNPTVPAGLGPMSLSVNGCVGNLTTQAMLLVPYPTKGSEYRAVNGCRPSTVLPGRDKDYQITAQAGNLGGKSLGYCLKATLKGAPGRETSLLCEERTQLAHLVGGLFEDGEERMNSVEVPQYHYEQGFQEQGVRIDSGPATMFLENWHGDKVDECYQDDKERTLVYHKIASVLMNSNLIVRDIAPGIQPGVVY